MISKKLKLFTLVVAVSLFSIDSHAQNAPASSAIHTFDFELPVDQSIHYMTRQAWTTRNGLPHNSINAIAQDKQGFLWFGTWQGPVRFDGKDFDIYDDIRVTGLPDIGIFSIALNPCDDSIYVAGARGGISRFHDNRWLPLEPAPPFINEVEIDKNCTIWVSSSEKGLINYENNERVSRFTTEQGLPSNNVYQSRVDASGNLWAATAGGLSVKRAGAMRFELIDDLPANRVRKLLIDSDGRLLVGTGSGLYRQQDDKFTFEKLLPNLNFTISAINRTRDGALWLGTYRNGVLRFYNGELQQVNTDNGLPNNHVLDILEDQEGSVWVSTHGGLMQFRRSLFTTMQSHNGLAGDFVRSVYEFNDKLYVGTSSGISTLTKAQLATFESPHPLANQSVLSFSEYNNQLLIGTYTNGLFIWDGERVTDHLTTKNVLKSDEVRAIAGSEKHGLFLGSPVGVTQLKKTEKGWQTRLITTQDGLQNNYITTLRIIDNKLWVASVSGLSIVDLDASSTTEWQVRQLDFSDLHDAQLTFQISQKGPYVFLATDRGLIYHHQKEDTWAIINRDQGLPFDNFLAVSFDGDANIWLGSNRGAIFIAHDEFEDFLSGKTSHLTYQRFTEVDGMGSSQINSGGPSMIRSQNGRVWMSTARGVSSVAPSDLKAMVQIAPPAVIASVTADGQRVSYGGRIPADTQRLVVNYAGLGFLMADHIEYQVRLVGFDDQWLNRGSMTTSEYTSLPANDYIFQVRAAYPGGSWSEPASFAFARSEHPWQQSWFWLSLAVAITGIATMLVRARIRFLSNQRAQLERMVAEKTRELKGLARQDSLTQLGNRRAFDEQLQYEVKRCERSAQPLSLAIIDVDHFKLINDRFLHVVGDQVLIELSTLLSSLLREVDYVARWGGEEFALLMPETNAKDALQAAERIRQTIEDASFNHLANDLSVTVSIGVASSEHYPNHSALLVAADKALYQAKQGGRNRTELA
ncbi:diguanylate cyclase (GGDEF)-like protein [Idiomarina fontislapidosi]|uniref:ligand-binding sensor domain-containing diguanylate cyclase n=1 Tax=Idiomarina fontislapidosi TaxID=263723 RepID=UPI000D9BFC22|nr:ligand-binding sensor domain-containing diguanylate cyclase [Idiomarina fontislapidosi]PYE34508.1 diguanylate cyclase (GGDEF)-like protein [Idiomarina fontislapidosi]